MDTPERNATRAKNIRTLWEALHAPKWTRDDLIDLGKAIFAKTPLKNLDPDKFDKLLPHLIDIVERLEAGLVKLPDPSPKPQDQEEAKREVPPETSKAPTEDVEPK